MREFILSVGLRHETQQSQCLRIDRYNEPSVYLSRIIYCVRSGLMVSPPLNAIDFGDVGFRFTLPNRQLSVRFAIELCGVDYSH